MAVEPDAAPCHDHPSVLLVSTDWRAWDITSTLVTVNSIVAQCLTRTCRDIKCTVVHIHDSIPAEIMAAAQKAHVQLIGSKRPRRVADPKKDWITKCWEQYYPHLVKDHNFSHIIGYFPQTAKTALAVRDGIRSKGTSCVCVLIVEGTQEKKSSEESAKLLNKADAVHFLGPLLFREYQRHVTKSHSIIFPVPHVGDPGTLHPLTPSAETPKDVVMFYPENGLPVSNEEFQYKTFVIVIKAISNVAKSYFNRYCANSIEWHIYGVPEERNIREWLKAVIQEHSVFPEFTWRLHLQPADSRKILQLASLCVSPWHASYDPNVLYPLLYGVPTLLCASSGVAETLFRDVARNDDDNAQLTAMAFVNCSQDTDSDGWTAKIQHIIYNPINAGANFMELGRRIRESVSLHKSMRTFSDITCGSQAAAPAGDVTALPPVSPRGQWSDMTTLSPVSPRGQWSNMTTLSPVSPQGQWPALTSPNRIQASGKVAPGNAGSNTGLVKPWTDINRYRELIRNTDEVYKMTARPRGFALIININKFIGIRAERKGSEVDEENFRKLFTQLNFSCIIKKDLTKQEIFKELDSLASSGDLWSHDCLVVCLMSHGKEGVISTSDNKTIAVTDVLQIFSQCRALKDKPKLLFIQACRGNHTDEGELRTDGPPEDNASRKPPVMSDILVMYPSSLGYKAFRNTAHGSWLVSKLVQVFSEHACHEHITELLTRVLREVSHMETSGNQSGQVRTAQPEAHWALRKLLYFFPGMET